VLMDGDGHGGAATMVVLDERAQVERGQIVGKDDEQVMIIERHLNH